MDKNVAIITARGGSKRIPGKNIKDFCGKPIIAYSIEAATQSMLYNRVMVSTDSEEIAETAMKYGATVPFLRSAKNSNDYATTADVIDEVMAMLEKRGENYDVISCLYPTAPFVTSGRLIEAMSLYEREKADSLAAVVRFSFPPQRAFIIKDGRLEYQYPAYALKRSQDLEPIYHDCGQFYICRKSEFLKYHSLIVPNTIPYVMKEEEVQDIDTLSDWKIAEAKYRILLRSNSKGKIGDTIDEY